MQIYEEITPQEQEAEQEPIRKRTGGGGSVLLMQAVLCLAILLLAVLLKLFAPGLYSTLRTQVDAEMQRTILIEPHEVPTV